MAADSAIIVLIDIFRLLVRSGAIAALLSTQTPAAGDHSINHEQPAMDQRWPQNSAGNGCSFAALHMSANGAHRDISLRAKVQTVLEAKRTCRDRRRRINRTRMTHTGHKRWVRAPS
jgi:hypothetical protein